MTVAAAVMAAALALAVVSQPVLAAREPKLRGDMLVSTGWLADHLKDKNIVVLCVASTRNFYDEGHIPGARLVLLDEIVTKRGDVPNELPPVETLSEVFEKAGVINKSRVVLYGERYGLLAARAYFTLDVMGHGDKTALLDGGLQRWKIERRPLATGTPAVKRGKFTPRTNAQIVVDTATMRRVVMEMSSNGPVLLDARPPEEFAGQKLSEDVHHAGHIPGSKPLYWIELLVSREDPVFKPAAKLRALFAERGVSDESEVVSYCRSGMQSSVDYFVAKYLGYPVRMYDGSFFEWSQEDLPVDKTFPSPKY